MKLTGTKRLKVLIMSCPIFCCARGSGHTWDCSDMFLCGCVVHPVHCAGSVLFSYHRDKVVQRLKASSSVLFLMLRTGISFQWLGIMHISHLCTWYIVTHLLCTTLFTIVMCKIWNAATFIQLIKYIICCLMFVPCIIRCSRNNQHNALKCTTPLFNIQAPACFGNSLSSSGRFLDSSELLEMQIE
jgi:hypothetical protein